MSGQVMGHTDMAAQRAARAEPADSGSRSRRGRTPGEGSPEEAQEGKVALIRVAFRLTDAEKDALEQALQRHFGHTVWLDIELDERIIGGVWVQVGDTIIDGSLQGRLEALRHHLRSSGRAMVLDSARSRFQQGNPL